MMELSVITAEKTIYQGKVKSLTVPTVTGEIGILPGHRSLIAKLDVGALRLVNAEGTKEELFVAGGFLEVNQNKISILADLAENLDSIELDLAVAARKKAEEMLSQASGEASAEQLQEELRVMAMREKLAQVAKYKK